MAVLLSLMSPVVADLQLVGIDLVLNAFNIEIVDLAIDVGDQITQANAVADLIGKVLNGGVVINAALVDQDEIINVDVAVDVRPSDLHGLDFGLDALLRCNTCHWMSQRVV